MDIYQRAWELLVERMKTKPRWSNTGLQELMLQCFVDAGRWGSDTELILRP